MASNTISSLNAASGIDAVQDYLAIDTANISTTQKINRNTLLNLSSQPVGLTDTQTLTNKTLTSPTISGPTLSGTITGTYTIGGTPTFPSSITTLTGTQTLTNKTLTSPTINSPTITNATISADAVIGYTTSNTGTLYGIGITTGQITGASSIASGALATNAVQAAALATNAIYLGSGTNTTDVTTTATTVGTASQITGMTATVTIPAGGRKVLVLAILGGAYNSGTGNAINLQIFRGTSGSGVQVGAPSSFYYSAVAGTMLFTYGIDTPSAGSVTYNAGFFVSGGTAHSNGAAQNGSLLVVLI